jgi:FtsH-binding integral membrane protein
MRTVSALGGGGATFVLIVSVALRVTPPNEPLIVALVVALTAVVLTMKLAELAPAATVTLAGTLATALLLASVTTVADGATALNVTVPWTADSVSGAGVGVPGVTVTVRSRRPS